MIVVRSYKGSKSAWEVDIRIELANGKRIRERRKSPITSKSGTQRWAEQRERELFDRATKATAPERKRACTVATFAPQYMRHCEALRQKPSVLSYKRGLLRKWIVPRMGDLPMDAISNARISALKSDLSVVGWSAGNNVLRCLSNLLRVAVEFGEIEALPCTITTFKRTRVERGFYDPATIERLIAVADGAQEVLILLASHAGLRASEIAGLEWADVDFGAGVITVTRQLWHGQVITPKSGKSRRVPMTARLTRVLRGHRHLRGPRVLYQVNGKSVSRAVLSNWLKACERSAGLPVQGYVHMLRHSFVSNLAAAGVPMRTLADLAGHASIVTTQGYAHLMPGAAADAVRVLDRPVAASTAPQDRGEIVETPISKPASH
jgi:integrase